MLAIVPLFVSFYRLPGDMVTGFGNSLVLSATCHAYCPRSITSDLDNSEPRGRELPPDHQHDTTRTPNAEEEERRQDVDDERDALARLAQSKLRWGVTPLTPELREAVKETGQEALHLGFATEENFISAPVDGELYL